MIDINLTLSVVTLNVNGQNILIKRETKWIREEKRPNYVNSVAYKKSVLFIFIYLFVI